MTLHIENPKRIPVGPYPFYYAIVDADDYEWLNQFKWSPEVRQNGRTVYARGLIAPGKKVYMHKLITGFTETDHRNRIGLDNRRENLRKASRRENNGNLPKRQGRYSSRFKGVSLDKKSHKWRAYADSKHIGLFDTEIEAALAYDRAAEEIFGEFAFLNFQKGGAHDAL